MIPYYYYYYQNLIIALFWHEKLLFTPSLDRLMTYFFSTSQEGWSPHCLGNPNEMLQDIPYPEGEVMLLPASCQLPHR